MLTILSTEHVDPSAQFGSFRTAIRRIADLTAHPLDTRSFNAKIQIARLGLVECSFIDSDPVIIERGLSNIERDKDSAYFLALQVSGAGTIRHLGRDVRLQAGDYSIFDSALPYSIEVESPVQRVVLRFPKSEFLRRGMLTDTVCGRAFSGHSGTSGLVSRLVRALYSENAESFPDIGLSLGAAMLDLIAEAESEDGARALTTRSNDQLLRRIRMIVLENLTDPDMSVSRIAEKAGISVRYIHRVFGTSGTTLSKWIENERLERAFQTLKNPNHRHRTVQDIAFSIGFNDSGYFSQRFMRKFGKSPSQVRSGT
jgi:AraC-like DNA-binding protein